MEIGICNRFPALTPFSIRREKAHEVFLLINRLHSYNKNVDENGQRKPRKIRRPAGDNWF